MYSIFAENENMCIEMGKGKSSVRYVVTCFANDEIHLESSENDLIFLKRL